MNLVSTPGTAGGAPILKTIQRPATTFPQLVQTSEGKHIIVTSQQSMQNISGGTPLGTITTNTGKIKFNIKIIIFCHKSEFCSCTAVQQNLTNFTTFLFLGRPVVRVPPMLSKTAPALAAKPKEAASTSTAPLTLMATRTSAPPTPIQPSKNLITSMAESVRLGLEVMKPKSPFFLVQYTIF